MKSRTRIESAVFQLTPTRTRFDLIINADGKSEKMDSGLLDPFLAHLKIARDQFAKGGYSIVLKPNPDSNPTWFTKGTVERFFRFVSSPEVLERVCTIESEILQIEGAISLHKNNDIGLINGEDHQENLVECTEGTKHALDSNEDKAIVLYQPGLHPPEASVSTTAQEGNSKVQVLRVLETRKSVLQKEQGMAFARAVAAGFDIDHMTPLMSFSECFGAARFMDACLKFMDLWTKKHEMGQWLEIEAADLSSSNASGITPASLTNNQKETNEGLQESLTNLHPEKASGDAGADDKPSMDHQAPNGNKEYIQGQYPHLMFPPWPIHSPPGALPVYPSYPMQGIPYYQNYPGNGPYFTPPYQFVEDPRINAGQRIRHRRHSMDSRGSNTESDSLEPNDPKTRSLDDNELNKEVSQGRESMKKPNHLGKKNSGMVVIRNINYITSKNRYSSCSESQSASDSETEGDSELQGADFEWNKSSSKSSKRRANKTISVDPLDSFDTEDAIHEKEADGEKWHAFQNCLLRDAGDDRKINDQDMLAFKREGQVKQRKTRDGADLLVLRGPYSQETQEGRKIDCVGDDVLHLRKASKDEVFLSSREGHYGDGRASSIDGQLNIQSIEEGSRGVYRRTATDDFIIPGQENWYNVTSSSSDLLAVNAFEHTSNKLDRSLSHTDESFMVPMRSGSVGQVGLEGRAAIDMEAEFPSVLHKPDNRSIRVESHVNYEPDDLSLMPKHGSEKSSIGFDPALDYEMQAHATGATGSNNDKEVVAADYESKKLTRLKVIPDPLNKKKITGVTKKGKPSKLSPLDEARARAESLRSFKADLQKVKKEKEEEEMKRLESLKIARQNRISARSGPTPALSPLRPQQTRKQLPTKHSQGSRGVSKFSDSEPGSFSPLQRVPKRTLSLTSNNSPITSKPSRLNNGSQRGANRLTHSASSLPEPKKNNEVISPDPKASMARIRRLSEPKVSSSRHTPLKPQSTETVSKRKLSHEPESKKLSAISNLDKAKAATLPGLKIASEGPMEPTKEISEIVKGKKSSTTYAGSNQNKKNDNMDHVDTDDNPVTEKTIVILECETPAACSLRPSEETARVLNGHYDNHTYGGDTVASGYAHIHAPISEPDVNGTGRISVDPKLMEQSSSCEVTAEYEEKESPKFSSISTAGKPQQPPIARVSSLEDPCTEISEHRKAPPTSIETDDTAKVCVSDLKSSKLEKIPETLENSQVKESSRGFRRLLKLGRKNHSAAESDNNGSVIEESNNATNADASSEGFTLRNLISEDGANTTSRKASRHFSLLSPFRSKNSEKKLMT